MAELFLATPKSGSSMPARIALKRILPVFSGDPDFLRAFLDEARVAALLSHPRFARTYEVGEVDGSLYLAMDYVDGVSLSTLSKAAQKAGVNFPWPLMVRIAIDLCEALHIVHNLKSLDGAALQLVHRDVSLSNVMVDRSGEVKLIDFGIARSSFQWHRTLPGVVKANLACAAPELFRGAAVDARADLYGVGLSVYEMLLGRHAFTAAEPDILRSVLEDAPAPLAEQRRDLPPRLCQLVHSALAKDPARRPRTAQEMGAALEACLAEAGLKVARADVARFLAQHDGDQVAKYHFMHMVRSLQFIPYGVAVDEFQHIVYENPNMTPEERNEAWRKLEKIYLPHRNYDDNEHLLAGRFWQRQNHIFNSPFYYIDYTLAQICAFQFWTKDRQNHTKAWADYLRLCKAGGSRSFLGLVELANLRSPFEDGCVESVIGEIRTFLNSVDDSNF